MLEILPLGGCKGDGVRRLLEHIGVSAERAIAFGDGENDVEVLVLSNECRMHPDAFLC